MKVGLKIYFLASRSSFKIVCLVRDANRKSSFYDRKMTLFYYSLWNGIGSENMEKVGFGEKWNALLNITNGQDASPQLCNAHQRWPERHPKGTRLPASATTLTQFRPRLVPSDRDVTVGNPTCRVSPPAPSGRRTVTGWQVTGRQVRHVPNTGPTWQVARACLRCHSTHLDTHLDHTRLLKIPPTGPSDHRENATFIYLPNSRCICRIKNRHLAEMVTSELMPLQTRSPY